jgi:hypothetical protein
MMRDRGMPAIMTMALRHAISVLWLLSIPRSAQAAYISLPTKQNKRTQIIPVSRSILFSPEATFKLWKPFPGPFHLLDCYPSIVYKGDPPGHDFTDEAMDDANKPLNESVLQLPTPRI